jgi:hypothetical protein
MKRIPSIHITLPDFEKALKTCFPKKGPIDWDYKSMAEDIMRECKKSSSLSRHGLAANKKTKERILKSPPIKKGDTDSFLQMLYLVRRNMKHRAIKIIQQGTGEYSQLKLATKHANDFCTIYELPTREGFREFIEIALKKAGNYRPNIFNTYYETIAKIYEAKLIVRDDPNRAMTEEAYKAYTHKIASKTGSTPDWKNEPEIYATFVEVAKICKELRVKPQIYIEAQFYALEWKNGLPEINQLTTQTARQRYSKFLFEKGITPQEALTTGVDWAMIKKHGKKNTNRGK